MTRKKPSSYNQRLRAWKANYPLIEKTYLYEVYSDGDRVFINWLGTTVPAFSKRAAREWAEDVMAWSKLPKAWVKHLRHVYMTYGNESSKVQHIGYSRGGGLAAFFGGTGYGALTVKGLKVKKGAKLVPVKANDPVHFALGILDPYGRYPGFKNIHKDPAYAMFGPR